MEILEKIKGELSRNDKNIIEYYKANLNKITSRRCACGTFLSTEDLVVPERHNEASYQYVLFRCSKCYTINAKEIKRKFEKAKIENISLLMLILVILWKMRNFFA